VLGDRGEDLLPQEAQQIGLAARRALVRQQDLQPLPRHWSGAPAPERVEEAHAALRPNRLSNRRLRSVGMLIGTLSPRSLRAASRSARAGALVELLSVTGEPMFEARSTSSLSGMMPSSGVERMSRTSSMLSISPRPARWTS